MTSGGSRILDVPRDVCELPYRCTDIPPGTEATGPMVGWGFASAGGVENIMAVILELPEDLEKKARGAGLLTPRAYGSHPARQLA